MNKLTKLSAALLTAALLAGCNAADTSEADSAETSASTSAASENTAATTSASTTTASDAASAPEAAEPVERDFEILALGDTLAEGLKALYLDYLDFENSIVLEKTTPTIMLDGLAYSRISGEDIKTYDDLKSIFSEFCTDEFSDMLLTESSYIYKDIGGSLYASGTELCLSYPSMYSYISNYEQNSDTIVFNLVEVGGILNDDGTYEHNSETTDHAYTMTAVKKDGKWLVSDCSNIIALAYFYNGFDYNYDNISEPSEALTTEDGSFEYIITDDHAEITQYIGTNEEVVTPSEINGYPVKVIGHYAFGYDGSKAKDITVSEGVEELGFGCFSSAVVESVRLPKTLTSVSPCCFEGSSVTNVEFTASEPVALSYDVFKDCKQLESISADEFVLFDQTFVEGSDMLVDVDGITENTVVLNETNNGE